MKLPLNYAIRNLYRRKWRTMTTAFGIAIVIFASILMIGLSLGIYEQIDIAGEENNMLLISSKGTNMMISNISDEHLPYLNGLPNIKKSITEELLISPEVYDICYISHSKLAIEPKTVYVRGLNDIGYEVHHNTHIIEGRLPEYEREIVVGCSLWAKMGVPKDAIKIGEKLILEKEEWTICGIFSTHGSVIESEVWVYLDELQSIRRRWNPSCVTIKFKNAQDMRAALPLFEESGVYSRYFKAIPEKDYYREASGALNWIYGLSILMSIAVATVGLLIGVNTMYSNIMNRRREIATYQVIGFSTFDIFCTFINESLIMTSIGGFTGIYLGTLLDRYPLATAQGAFFVMVDWKVIMISIMITVVIALLGAILPLSKILSSSVLDNMRK